MRINELRSGGLMMDSVSGGLMSACARAQADDRLIKRACARMKREHD